MSSQDSSSQPIRRTRSQSRRNTLLNVDLNAAPPTENRDQEGDPIHVVSGDTPQGLRGASLTVGAIDVEALDDDVIISSPRAFAAAKNNSRRNQGRVIVLDVDSEDRVSRGNSRNRRRRVSTNQATNNGDIHIDLEGHSCPKRVDLRSAIPAPPPPKEPTFSCPVCMGPLVDEMSTKCGHIFCKVCIKASIAAQGKCPTCRRKLAMKDTIRVYLPTTN